jgi:hypothetical protein
MKTNASTPAMETHSTTSANWPSPTNADVKKKQKEKQKKKPNQTQVARDVPPGPAKGRVAAGCLLEERGWGLRTEEVKKQRQWRVQRRMATCSDIGKMAAAVVRSRSLD